MKVELIDYTGKGAPDPMRQAANLLVFTKNTRLNMDKAQLEGIDLMDWEDVKKELEYMSNTIPSSWEFLHYTFLISGVSRAFTHQFVRTRTGSYAQQSMRVTDMAGFEVNRGPSIETDIQNDLWETGVDNARLYYDSLLENGVKIEDARGILPTNIETNIVASFNMRTLSEIIAKRASIRTQGEYRDVIHGMADAAIAVHPFLQMFLRNRKIKAAEELEKFLVDNEADVNLVKALDIMRDK